MEGKNITIIGCGNLGQAILKGLIKSANNVNLVATKRDPDAIKHFEKEGVRILGDNIKAIENADLILLALKPYNFLEVLKDLAPHIDATKQVVVSLATGVMLSTLRETVQSDIPIYRAMPNTAADVGASMTCIASNHSSHDKLIEECFNTIGSTIRIDEKLMDAATVLGACGVAFVLRFMRGMVQGGVQIGFDSKTASTIVNQTVKGAAELLISGGQHPEFEIDKVTTPKGCTISGLNEMEHNGFSSALIKGIVSSFDAIDS
jgi:pyrroline-5-carboxylate reductase